MVQQLESTSKVVHTRPGVTDCLPPSLLSPPGVPCCSGQLCLHCTQRYSINTAAELTAADANNMLARYPGAPLFILGNFNTCKLDSVLPSLQQYVDIPTRRANILDLCHGNIADAFQARSYPPLGAANQNIISLLSLYRQHLKQHEPQHHSAPQWSRDAITRLQGSLV